MNRRYAHDRAAVTLTGGDDRDLSPCARYELDRRANRPDEKSPYDVLIDVTSGPDFHQAVREARTLCGSCPLMATCLPANREEQWAQAVITGQSPQQRAATSREKFGKWAQHRAARVEALREFIAIGLGVDEAAARLGLDRKALQKWCANHDQRDLYYELNPEPTRGNQYRQTALGTVTTRRKKAAA